MLGIILCDDDKFILNIEAERIRGEIEKNKLEAKICCITTESKEMFRFLNNNPGVYLYFIDLDFGTGELNGIDIAKQIKSIEPTSKIVFVTNHKEMAFQVLSSGVEPFGFLEKTTDMNKLSIGYRKYIQMASTVITGNDSSEEQIHINVGIDEYVTLKISQITYVEAEKSISHAVSYHTMDGSKITVRETIEHVLEQLKDSFIRSHRSAIVNKKHMIGVENGVVKLSNGQEAPCSFRMKSEVKKWLP